MPSAVLILTNTLTLANPFSNYADVNDFSADISIQNNVDSEITDEQMPTFTGAARTTSPVITFW